jgi:hypothetical protein
VALATNGRTNKWRSYPRRFEAGGQRSWQHDTFACMLVLPVPAGWLAGTALLFQQDLTKTISRMLSALGTPLPLLLARTRHTKEKAKREKGEEKEEKEKKEEKGEKEKEAGTSWSRHHPIITNTRSTETARIKVDEILATQQ